MSSRRPLEISRRCCFRFLDEGFLTDSHGQRVDFRNTIIVLTSNLGAELLVRPDTQNSTAGDAGDAIKPEVKEAVMDTIRASFAPEFLNRIDEFIVFQRLSKSALRDIVDIRLTELQARLDDRRITLIVSSEVKDWLCDQGYDPRYGARPLNRLISEEIGNGLANQIIRGDLRSGESAEVVIGGSGDHLDVVPGGRSDTAL